MSGFDAMFSVEATQRIADLERELAEAKKELAAQKEAKEKLRDALCQCLSDLKWAENFMPKTNFQCSIIKANKALSNSGPKEELAIDNASEIAHLKRLLQDIPQEDVIDRMGLENRIKILRNSEPKEE